MILVVLVSALFSVVSAGIAIYDLIYKGATTNPYFAYSVVGVSCIIMVVNLVWLSKIYSRKGKV